jgi:hypothetical protein
MALLTVRFQRKPESRHPGHAHVAIMFEDFPQVKMCFVSDDLYPSGNEPIVANSEGVR